VISPAFIPEERAVAWCRAIREANRPYFAGGIFPHELAVFLAACETCGVDLVIESGRQDGYSTSVLADYAERTGTPAVSIDRVEDPERDAAARRRLAGRPVDLLDGPVERVLPDAIPADARRVALLIDGPKDHIANRLLLAAAVELPIVLFGCHGWYQNAAAGRELERWFPDVALAEIEGHEFAAFRAWEQELVAGRLHGSRGLDRSTLAISRVRSRERRWTRLLLHDAGRGALESARYVLHLLRGERSGMLPAAVIANDWARRRGVSAT